MEILGVFFKSMIEFVAGLAPGWLLRRYYAESRLAELIEVDLRTTNPVVITNQTVLPEANVYLRVTNFLPFEAILAQGSIDIWLGQPIAKQIALRQPITLRRHSTNMDVFFTAMLADNQIAYAAQTLAEGGPGKSVSVNGTLILQTKVRSISKQFRIERRDREADAALWLNPAKVNA